MSRTRPDEAELRMLEFACDKCEAAPGEWCMVYRDWLFSRPTGRPTPMLHSSRFWVATAVGLLPIQGAA